MSDVTPETITLEMMRESLYAAVVCDALDGLGYTHQSPRVPLLPLTVEATLVGRCKTTLWGDMYHADPSPYELELLAVDGCRSDDVLIAAVGRSDPGSGVNCFRRPPPTRDAWERSLMGQCGTSGR